MPTQIAPQLNSATDATTAPPAAMPPAGDTPLQAIPVYRIRQFMGGVGERLRHDGAQSIPEAQTVQAIQTERRALAAALDSHEFRHALATGYQQAFSALVPSLALSLDAAHQQTDQVIVHRVNDARWLAAHVGNEDFLKGARAAATVAPSSSTYQLPPEKIDEMVERFLAFPPQYGMDALTHIDQNMRGECVGHMALAQLFAQPSLQAVLAQKLAQQQLPLDVADRLSRDWLEARRKPAETTVEALTEGGAVYRAVMQRAAALDPSAAHGHHGAPANDNPPQPTVQHVAHQGLANPNQAPVMNV